MLKTTLGWILGVLAVVGPAAGGLQAQYFGQNQVIYHTFDFREMHTAHFDIYFYPAESLATADAARMAERWYARHAATMRDTFPRKPIVFYADFAAFQQNNIVQGIGQGTGGVTEPIRSRAILPFTGVYAENNHVLGHELVHVFQFDIANAQKGPGLAAMDRLPQWLIEGMAEYMSLGRNDVNTAMWLRDAALRNDLPTIRQLGRDRRYFPYRYGEALWAYIGGRWGDEVIPSLYRAALRGGLEPAVRTVLGLTTDSLSKAWRASIMSQYLPTMAGRVRPEVVGTRLLKPFSKYGDFDVSPVLSPDGKLVAFYTQRGVFEIDLYVADAVTGRIVRKLTSPNRDLHFDALNFINSAGAWSPDGRKLAVPVFKEGRNEINIYDVRSGHVERTIKLEDVYGINDVAWGPNGQMIIAGQHGGIVDLYLYNVKSGRTEQLTHSRYAKLQPTWSPDGRYIAFATDSGPGGGTNFDTLAFAPMRIALMDMMSHTTQVLPLFTGAKHINPQFSPDGTQLYFVSDRGGFDDIYRVTLATGDVAQMTNLATGVSGITSLSPTLSVAAVNGRMMFTVFEHGGYALHRIDAGDRPGIPVVAADTAGTSAATAAGVLPPPDVPGGGAVTARLDNPVAGLPGSTVFPTGPYDRKFALEQIGGGVGVGIGGGGGYYGGYGYGSGAYGAGGLTAVFGDVLENNQFIASVGGAGDIQDFGGSVTYINLSHRWNYGLTLSHTPLLTGGTSLFDSSGVQRFDYIMETVYDEGAQAFAQYPFSPVHRVEFSASYDYIHYQLRRDAYTIDAAGNYTLVAQGQKLQAPPGLSLASVGVAFVGDYSTFGLTSPVAGARYRFGVSPYIGNVQFMQVTADYRHYFLANPVTFAFRAIHYGRYGKDAESIYPYYLGDPYLDFVRGYDPNSFSPRECPTTGTGCPAFDRLVGSKIAATNFEIRVPVLGVSQYGLINFPYLPMEVAPFVDAGVAWANGSPPTFKLSENSTAREPVISSGVSIRVNLLGYLVGEVYAAYPWMRPGAGWQYGFQLLPGW